MGMKRLPVFNALNQKHGERERGVLVVNAVEPHCQGQIES